MAEEDNQNTLAGDVEATDRIIKLINYVGRLNFTLLEKTCVENVAGQTRFVYKLQHLRMN